MDTSGRRRCTDPQLRSSSEGLGQRVLPENDSEGVKVNVLPDRASLKTRKGGGGLAVKEGDSTEVL